MIRKQCLELAFNSALHIQSLDRPDGLDAFACKPTLSENVSLTMSSKRCSMVSCTKPAAKMKGKAPKMATSPNFHPITSDRMMVLKREVPTTVMTPMLGPANDFMASGSVESREVRDPDELAFSSKKETGCFTILSM